MKTTTPSSISSTINLEKEIRFHLKLLPVLFWSILACYSINGNSQAGNTAVGDFALPHNNGNSNTVVGDSSMFKNTTGSYNTTSGFGSLFNNTTGWSNTVSGYHSMRNNTIGGYNVALGNYSLFSNIDGKANSALGYASLYKNTSGANNTAVGYWSMYNNLTGNFNTAIGNYSLNFNTTGYENSANGYQSLYMNQTGYWNTANGYQSLYSNKTGSSNTANGYQSLFLNTGSFNTASGFRSMYSNTTGQYNTGIGYSALSSNTYGSFNTALGRSALVDNTIGFYNTAAGNAALAYNTSGHQNTASGYAALYTNTTGYGNTAIGYYADVAAGNLTNATAIGYNAIATANNQIMLGNSAVTAVRTFGAIIWPSDGRFKRNMKENVPGLEFIKQLRPLTYNYDIHGINAHSSSKEAAKNVADNSEAAKQNEEAINRKEKIVYTGFIAQEVEATAKKLGYDFSGVYKPENEKDIYGLSYAEFVVPLVKAVQELTKLNDEKDAKIDGMQKQIDELKRLILPTNDAITAKLSDAFLEQNIPNPFTNNTIISYTLPQKFVNAQISITDKNGKMIRQVSVSGSGKGSLRLDTASLSSGNYNYSLLINGRLISTKQMLLLKQ